MANWNGTARSNYFKVKDLESFQSWTGARSLEIITKEDPEHGTLYGFFSTESDYGGFVSYIFGEDGEEDLEVDIAGELAEHLADGWVGVLMEAGAEKVRYISGFAIAINNKGDKEEITLSGIYELAQELGEHCTEETY